jgi:hypothetical protein
VLVRLDHVIARDYFKLEERVASAIFVIDIRSCTVRINSESGKKMEPFQQQFNVSVDAGLTSGSALETVPAGKLAVIEMCLSLLRASAMKRQIISSYQHSKTTRPFETFRSSQSPAFLGLLEAIPSVRSPLQKRGSVQ